jgi:two-component system cell cycle response regulator DivK
MATVLIIEDNAANMTLATFLLQSAGHSVLSATDAESGVTLARGRQRGTFRSSPLQRWR